MRPTPALLTASVLTALACGGGGGPAADPGELATSEALLSKWASPDEYGWNKAIVFTDDNDIIYLALDKYFLLARDDGRLLRSGHACEMGSGSVEPGTIAHAGGSSVRFACSRGGGITLDAKTGQISESDAPFIDGRNTYNCIINLKLIDKINSCHTYNAAVGMTNKSAGNNELNPWCRS